jgi:hypothetical protein
VALSASKPTSLSRHVSIHQTDLEHYNPTNALVAVMLVTSVLRPKPAARQVQNAAIAARSDRHLGQKPSSLSSSLYHEKEGQP